jgi:cell division protein FtsL
MAVRRRNSRKKEPFRTRTWMVLLLVFVGELLAYTWCRVQYVNVGYELSRVTEKHAALTTLQNSLKVELARLKSPARIEKIARDKLGLVRPTPDQVITLP